MCLLSSMFRSWVLCWLCSLSEVLAPHDSNIDSHAWVCWLFFVLFMPLWSGKIPSVDGLWLNVPLTWSHFISHNFFATARKIIYTACSVQAGWFSIGRNWQYQVHSPAVSSGRSAGSLPEQRLAFEVCCAISGCLLFTQKIRKFRMECKWKIDFVSPNGNFLGKTGFLVR